VGSPDAAQALAANVAAGVPAAVVFSGGRERITAAAPATATTAAAAPDRDGGL
jgi:hypothetical protein